MYIKFILVFFTYHLNVISGQGIDVLFDNTIILNNSTINWSNSNLLQCSLQTTILFDSTTITTVETTQVQTSQTQTSISTPVQSAIGYTCPDKSFGVNCNISSAVCDVANPCLNGAICYSNNTSSLGYICQCASGFSGYDCEYDNRICAEDTCWNNGTCIEVNATVSGNNITTFHCQCVDGYDGTNCELETDMCSNITCENQGFCVSSYHSWSCACLDASLYSGIYCQDKSSALVTKQALSKSFAIVAIAFMCCVVAFVLIMDILKYVFKIDPVDRELHRLKMEKEKEGLKKFTKKKLKKKTYFQLFTLAV